MPKYYPVMLDVRDRLAIVVGGDRVAAEKAAALSASGALVHVICLEFCDELLLQAERKQVTLLRKTYEPGDLAGAFVSIAATSDPGLVQAIWAETQERGQLVNIVDMPEYCASSLPSPSRPKGPVLALPSAFATAWKISFLPPMVHICAWQRWLVDICAAMASPMNDVMTSSATSLLRTC